jgi:predicted ferric reductase
MKKSLRLIIFVLVNLAIIFYGWWAVSGPAFLYGGARTAVALGRITGLLAVFFILLELLLIGRVKWIERVMGLDKLARIHHVNGFLALGCIILHPFFLLWGYSSSVHISWWRQLNSFIFHWRGVGLAAIATVLFVAVVVLSVGTIARRFKLEIYFI